MMDKQWTYSDVTEQAEISIHRLMESAAKDSAATDSDRCLFYRTAAWGVWYGWNQLTMGCQEQGDTQRLEAMTHEQDISLGRRKPEGTTDDTSRP